MEGFQVIRISKFQRPNKKSGHPLEPNYSTKVKGVVITNTNAFTIYVDRVRPKKAKKKLK